MTLPSFLRAKKYRLYSGIDGLGGLRLTFGTRVHGITFKTGRVSCEDYLHACTYYPTLVGHILRELRKCSSRVATVAEDWRETVLEAAQRSSQLQFPDQLRLVTVVETTTIIQVHQNAAPSVVGDEMQNEGLSDVKSVIEGPEKLEDDLQKLGMKIKQHEDSIRLLKAEKNKLDDSILDMQGIGVELVASIGNGDRISKISKWNSGRGWKRRCFCSNAYIDCWI